MKYKDYYQVLGISRDAKEEDIKKAYRRLARKYHPDVSKEADAEQHFKEVGEAYEVLKDPEKRQAYDQFGNQWQPGQDFRPPPGWESNYEFTGSAGGFSDFFENLFGGGAHHAQSRGFHQPAEDQQAKILIQLEDAYHGHTIAIRLRLESGELTTLNVKVPKGITEGKKIRLSGQGPRSPRNPKRGDLYLQVAFQEHPWFRAKQKDIYLDLPITPWEAALGGTVKVPTLGGPVELKIPQLSQSGKKLRLPGRGLPGNPPGDQFVIFKIMIPAADTPEKQACYRTMAQLMAFDPRADIG